MLKIKNQVDCYESAYIESPGVAAIKTSDHVKIISFRATLGNDPLVEVIFAYCDSAGAIEAGTTTQFFVRGDSAKALMDETKFDKFIEHLEDIAIASFTPGDPSNKNGCPIELEK